MQPHILTTIPVFKMGDPMEEAIAFFKDSTFSHVAITENDRFVGMLNGNDSSVFEAGGKIEDFRYNVESFFVKKDTSWLDALEIFARNDANIIPVLDENDGVLGYFDLADVIGIFIGTPFFKEPGGILVLAKGIKDYSFSEISQIVESNNTKLWGAFITGIQNDVIQITLKIGSANLNEVIQSFRRYNYSILFGNTDDQFLEDLRQRSDYLDKYLNV